MAFTAARGRITPGDATIWEVKHLHATCVVELMITRDFAGESEPS
jgi:hypothetical protein